MSQAQEKIDEPTQDWSAGSYETNDPEYDAWFRRKVERSIKAADEGLLISDEEVNRRAEMRIQKTLQMHQG